MSDRGFRAGTGTRTGAERSSASHKTHTVFRAQRDGRGGSTVPVPRNTGALHLAGHT